MAPVSSHNPGNICSYIRCVDVEYESKREEEYYDVQVTLLSFPLSLFLFVCLSLVLLIATAVFGLWSVTADAPASWPSSPFLYLDSTLFLHAVHKVECLIISTSTLPHIFLSF
jgi:hypothetical protein